MKTKKPIDSVDRAILRLMYNAKRTLTGHQIAKRVSLSPPAIRPRLNKLQARGIITPIKIGKIRKLGNNVTAPSRINWGLDVRKTKKRR